MVTIANSVNTVSITNSTVDNAVGLCFFDPATEALIEVNQTPSHYLTVEPNQQVLRKYYMVTAPGQTVSYAKIKIANKTTLEDKFSIKTIIGSDNPTTSAYLTLPDFNSFRYLNPVAGEFIPVWILITSKTPINEVVSIDIELEYE